MIDIFDISGKKIESGEVLSDLLITSSCQHVEELMKSNYVQLSWNDAQKYTLPVGSYIVPFPNERNPYTSQDARYPIKYRLFEPYIAEAKHETNYVYEPQFQHPIMWLSYLPLMLVTGNVSNWNDAIKKTTWGYTGTPRQIAAFIVDCINWLSKHLPAFGDVMGDGWTACVDTDLAPTVTVNFESTSIMGGASQIASACDCEFHFDYAQKQFRLGIIRYGEEFEMITGVNVGVASVSRTKKDYHNAFLVKGSTRNLSQPTDGGENMQVTERLTLDPTKYPDSIIYTDPDGKFLSRDEFLALGMPSLIEELVFDDIYPKLELYLYNVRERKCWKLDSETGNKVEDEDGEEDTDGKKYKTYSKWYFRLAYPIYITDSDGNRMVSRWVAYKLSDKNIIEGQTAQITFLPNYESDAKPSLMLGQGDFDVVYFDKQTQEKGEDDINANGFTALEGDYRIVFKEDNNVIIPTTSKGGIFPQGETTPSLKGNKATLINVVVDEAYKEQARLDLEMVAKRKVSLLRSDLNNYELSSNPVYFEENNPQLHLGQAVIYDDGQRFNDGISYRLSTHIIKIVTQLDYPFVKEITIGNEKVKGDISTLKEQVKTMVTTLSGDSGGGVYVIGLNDFTPATDSNVYSARRSRMEFLSKTEDGTAKSTITWEKVQKFIGGLLVGKYNSENGGSWSLDSVGRSHLVTDYMEVRMKAIFEELVIKKTSAIGGKEIISPAGGVKIHKVEVVSVTYNATEQKAYRCYFLAEQEGDAVDNDFAIDDQVRSESFNLKSGAYHKAGNHFYWRLVIGRDENPVELEGIRYHYIDLSDSDCATDSDIPAIGDTLSQCGNRSDIVRQNCLIFSSVDVYSPSVSLYHGINSYSFANKEYVEYGVNKQTDKAFFNVYGDLYIGDRPTKENGNEGKSYIRYDSAKKLMEIKAKIDAKSTIGDRDIDAYIKENTLSSDDVKNLINNSEIIGSLQNQIDGAIETWYYEGKPTLENLPAQGWTDDETKNKHIGDLYYDKASGKGYRFLKDETGAYIWAIITDEDITKALALAGEKKRIFGVTPTPPYDVNDLWVYAVYPSDGSKYNKEILRCVTAKSAGEKFSIDDWALASDYATNTKVAQLDYLKDALKNDTVVDGGLILSTLIALRDKSKNIQSGINGAVQDAKYKGGGIAAWYGGEMGDIEDKSNYPGVTNWAKSLLRFDGSGYLANGNISWEAEGKVNIKDLHALINTADTDVLNVLASIYNMFSTRVKESETLILPQLRFGGLFIERLRQEDLDNNDVVLTQKELKDRFVTIDWFNKVFSVVDDKQSDLPVNGNISSGASIHAKMGLWSDGGISALGNSASSGGSGGGGLDAELLWSLLGNSGTEQISKSHLADALAGYATEEWIEGKGYLTSHQDISGKADRSELSGYLPLTGGTLTGNLNLGGNTLFAGDISVDTEGKNWNLPRKNSIKLLLCRDVPATGSPSSYMSGVSILTNYVGFQLVSYGGWKDELYFRKIEDNGVWHDWYRIYHEGFKPTKSDVGLGNVDNTADANKSVSYATTAGSANAANGVVCNLLPNAGSTVKSNKDAIVQYFNKNSGLGTNVAVSSFLIRNWDNDSATVISDSVYSFIKISGGYSTSKYAQYLLSSFGEKPVGVIGRSENTWGKFHWIAYKEDIPTKVSQLSNDSGYITSSGSCAYASTAGIANSVAWSNVSGRPTSMPASDVYAWAKAATKPYYTYDEIKVKGLVSVADFTRVVIALCEVTKSQAYTGTFSSGEILYYRSNGIIPIEYARVNFIDCYNLNYDAYYSLETSTENESKDKPISSIYASAGFRKCTFVYNGKHYAGVEVYFSQAASYYWRGYSHGHTVFGVIVEQGGTVKNEEIYNSLSYNGQDRSGISFGNVRANSFVRKGSSDSYVLLGGGGHSLISSLSVAVATKLQTARTIWGQSFDGTSDITGPFQYESVHISNLNEIWSTGPLWLQNGARTTGDVIISHNNGGRVGIGTLSPRRKFHVEGTSYFTDEMLLESSDFKTFRISRTNVGNASLGVNSNGLYIYSNVTGVGEGEMNFKGGVGLGIDCTPQYKLHVNGDMATTGRAIVGSIVIGDITISYDKANKGLRIAGGGLYTDSYLSSLGVDTSTALSVKKWADSIQITTESDAELATAYSIGNLYRMINSNQKSITESLNQSVSALQGRCTSLEQRVSALEKKVNK